MRVDIHLICHSLQEAEETKKNIYENYPPWAYDTSLTIHPPTEPGGSYLVEGYRFDSAD